MGNLSEYRKQRKRIRDFISRNKRKGYFFNYELPAIPKSPTRKDIENLKKVTPKVLRETGFFVDTSTGEATAATEHFAETRRKAAIKAAQTRRRVSPEEFEAGILNGERHLLNELLFMLGNPDDKYFYKRRKRYQIYSSERAQYIIDTIHQYIAEYGEDEIAHRIAQNFEAISDAIDKLLYKYPESEINLGANIILDAIRGRSMTASEARDLYELGDEVGYV